MNTHATTTTPDRAGRRRSRPQRRAGRMARALALTALTALLSVVGLAAGGAVPNGSHWAAGLTKISGQLGEPNAALRGSSWAGAPFATTARGSSWS